MTDRELFLIEGIRQNDINIMRHIFDDYYVPLCTYALRMISSYQDVEDLVEDIFITFWEKKRGSSFKGSLRSYLFGAVHKACLHFLRKNGRRVFADLHEATFLAEEPVTSIDLQEMNRRREILEKEISNLPMKSRKVFTIIVLDNLSYKEAAAKLNVSVNTIKTHYSRALKQLRKRLAPTLRPLFSKRST